MLIKFFSLLIMVDMVYPDSTCIIENKSFTGVNIHLFPGFLFESLSYCFRNIWVFRKVLIIPRFGFQCNKFESGLKTHRPSRGFVQLSLSEIR